MEDLRTKPKMLDSGDLGRTGQNHLHIRVPGDWTFPTVIRLWILVRNCSSRVLEDSGNFLKESDEERVFDPFMCIAKFEWCLEPNSDH